MIKAFLYFPHDNIPEDVKKSLTSQGVVSGGWDMLVLSSNPDEFMESVEMKQNGKTVYVHALKEGYKESIEKCFPMITGWSIVELKGKRYGAGMVFADQHED